MLNWKNRLKIIVSDLFFLLFIFGFIFIFAEILEKGLVSNYVNLGFLILGTIFLGAVYVFLPFDGNLKSRNVLDNKCISFIIIFIFSILPAFLFLQYPEVKLEKFYIFISIVIFFMIFSVSYLMIKEE